MTRVPQRLVLFDGVCGLCDRLVSFLVRVDHARTLRYAPLQGETAQALRERFPEIPADLASMAFVDDGRVYLRSRAVLRVLGTLGWPWRAFAVFSWLPLWLTDAGYRLVARTRYGIFGKLDACRLPNEEEKSLFLP